MIAASGEGRSGVWGSARPKFAFTLPRPTRAFAVSLLRHSILGWGMGSLNDSLRQCILRWPGILHRSPIIADGLQRPQRQFAERFRHGLECHGIDVEMAHIADMATHPLGAKAEKEV